ncbi:MAG: SCP2 sterol-binding domain-containing protein [Gammaproteobacteria bacterium]|nr:SCP2 sterol-binding domain-containing protein [Gammaproteobacteria bacterium]
MSTAFYALIESKLNNYCQLDPDYKSNLKMFTGKVILIQIKDPQIQFYLLSNGNSFQVHQHYDGEIDATISASLVNYIFLVLADEKEQQEQVINQKVKITGNVKLAQSLQQYFDKLEIDWEEHLSHLTGDTIAYGFSLLADKFKQKYQQTYDEILTKVMHELIDEAQVIVTKEEIISFVHQVDHCRNAVDRIEAKIKKLEQTNKQ